MALPKKQGRCKLEVTAFSLQLSEVKLVVIFMHLGYIYAIVHWWDSNIFYPVSLGEKKPKRTWSTNGRGNKKWLRDIHWESRINVRINNIKNHLSQYLLHNSFIYWQVKICTPTFWENSPQISILNTVPIGNIILKAPEQN